MHYRPEIDGLRAIAVLSVVIFHAFPSVLSGGFIGVDIFFVISGFLITSIIFENLDNKTFSFIDFYGRRIRRIFPTLILVIVASIIAGWFLLLSDGYGRLGKHIAGGATFLSNFILAMEKGYFDNSAEGKPLLHLWSLAIEEQFYIIWPAVLWAAWKCRVNLLALTLCALLVSLMVNIIYIDTMTVETFFWPMGRFWEILSGSVLAYIILNKDKFNRLLPYIKIPHNEIMLANIACFFGSGLIIYGIIFIHKGLMFPGAWAIIPVMGTILIIGSGAKAWLNRILLMNPVMIWFGLISYPLYLWHWPILSFLYIFQNEMPGMTETIIAVVASIFLAWLTYKYIERPIRFGKKRTFITWVLLITLPVLGLVGVFIKLNNGFDQRILVNNITHSQAITWSKPNVGLGKNCEVLNKAECIFGQNPRAFLWGDSYAMHLSNALVSSQSVQSFIQNTTSACRPLIGLSIYDGIGYNRQWADDCLAHNDAVFDYLRSNPDITYVFLASPFDYTKDIVVAGDLIEGTDKIYLKLFKTMIDDLRAIDKRPVIIAPPPNTGTNLFSCWAQHQGESCDFNLSEISERTEQAYRLMNVIKDYAPVVYLSDYLCENDQCKTSMNGLPLYRDYGHLSSIGSTLLGEEIDLYKILRTKADNFWSSR